MKDWFRNHYKSILIIAICVCYYFVLFALCRAFDIDFDGYGNDAEDNIKIAKFYFITLPIASALPVILYELIKFIRSKSK